MTMFLGALYALFTHDLKRVLAWSTVSQLAYMFGALAAGAWSAAVLHLLAHGAFKALLFLAAGSVVHAVGGATSMEAMGGLRDKVPDTFVTMTLGFGALAGVVPLVGFFTKDAVIHGAYEEALHGRLVWPWVAWLLLASMVRHRGADRRLLAARLAAGVLRAGGRRARPPSTTRRPRCGCRWSCSRSRPCCGGLAVTVPGLLGPDRGEHLVPLVDLGADDRVVVLGTAVLRAAPAPAHGRDMWHRVAGPAPAGGPALGPRPGAAGAPARGASCGPGTATSSTPTPTARPPPRAGSGALLRRAQNGSVQGYLMVVVVGAAAVAVLAGVLA